MGAVLVVGSSNTDLVCRTERLPRLGETVFGSSFATFGGGKGANQAIAAARAGADVRFVGAIGGDDFGCQRLADLAAEGIDTAGVRTIDGVASGIALITVVRAGDNSIVIVPGANAAIRAEDAATAVGANTHAVLSLTLEIPIDAVRAAIAGNCGRRPVVLNVAPYDAARELAPLVDLLICNEIEASELLGRTVAVGKEVGAANEIRRMGAKAVALTLGERGALLASKAGTESITAPCVHAIDTTGAGDAFCGAVAAWLSAGAILPDAVRAGICAGTLAVTRAGAQPSLPLQSEIVAMLETLGAT